MAEDNSELTLLKERARVMGIKHHHNIGVEKLKGLIADALNTDADNEDSAPSQETTPKVDPAATVEPIEEGAPYDPERETVKQFKARMRKEATKLVRIRVTNMNPNKREHEGEIYTVANAVVGTLRKYVPFNNEEGWHVPQMILTHMQERECQIFVSRKGRDGSTIREGKLIKELSIEVLPPLTDKELAELAQRQAMAGGVE